MRRHLLALSVLLAAGAFTLLLAPGWTPSGVETSSRAHVEEPSAALLESDPPPVLEGSAPAGGRARPSRVGPAAQPTEVQVPSDGVTRVSLRVETVDAHTGARLRGRWSAEVVEFFDTSDADPAIFLEQQTRLQERAMRRSGEEETAALGADWAINTVYLLEPPAGYVTLARDPRLKFHRAAGVEQVWALAPLVREAVLHVSLLGPDGQPAEGARVADVQVGAGRRPVTLEPQGSGQVRVRGIPFLPGEPVHLELAWQPPSATDARAEAEETVTETIFLWADSVRRRDATTSVPDDLSERWSLTARLPGPLAGPARGRTSLDFDFVDEEVAISEVVAGDRRRVVSVRVRALDPDGRPLPGAYVGRDVTDSRGEALLHVREGPVTLRLESPGRFPATLTTEAIVGGENVVALREARGARLEVLVTDEEGHPRPCARLTVTGRVFDVENGVQRVDMFTDHRGWRSFARVQPGVRKVWAQWGSRKGTAEVELADGETRRLTIVAK